MLEINVRLNKPLFTFSDASVSHPRGRVGWLFYVSHFRPGLEVRYEEHYYCHSTREPTREPLTMPVRGV